MRVKAGQITSDIDKVYVSEFHHFNWQCAMRLHPAFAPRIFGRVEAVAARPATAAVEAVPAVQVAGQRRSLPATSV
jgi:hypothetical protein